jgi:hypothetical protein
VNEVRTRGLEEERSISPEQMWPLKAHFGKFDINVSKKLEWEFKKWVALTLIEPDLVFAPSGPVDMYWHFLIFHTKEYREFCEAIWGKFQHHPYGTQHGISAAKNDDFEKKAFQETVALYQKSQ